MNQTHHLNVTFAVAACLLVTSARADTWQQFSCVVVPSVHISECQPPSVSTFDDRAACEAGIGPGAKFRRYESANGEYFAGYKCMRYTSPWHE